MEKQKAFDETYEYVLNITEISDEDKAKVGKSTYI